MGDKVLQEFKSYYSLMIEKEKEIKRKIQKRIGNPHINEQLLLYGKRMAYAEIVGELLKLINKFENKGENENE